MKENLLYSDTELFAGIATGDVGKFRILFERYRERAYIFLKKILNDDTAAEEIVQEVFMRIWISRFALDKVEKPENYIFIIARNRAMDHFRKQTKERSFIKEYSAEPHFSDNDTEEAVLFHESRRLIEEAVATLPDQQKAVYTLSHKEGLTREQIADNMGISPNTVKNHLAAAIKSIREFLEKKNNLPIITLIISALK